jgi:hypothetical protein
MWVPSAVSVGSCARAVGVLPTYAGWLGVICGFVLVTLVDPVTNEIKVADTRYC